MAQGFTSDFVTTALKNEIKVALAAAHNALEIGPDVWDGESKAAYDSLKASIQQDMDGLEFMIGGL